MSEHTPYRCGGDPDHCHEAWCSTHHGELQSCSVCGGGEVTLPKECPGVPMTDDQMRRVADGWINFVGGKWVALGKSDAQGRAYREKYDGARLYR